jgi:hypothetical protein
VTDEATPDKGQNEPKNPPDSDESSKGDTDPKQGLTLKKIFRDRRSAEEGLAGEVDDG